MASPQTVGEALDLARRTLQDLTPTPILEAQLLLMSATGRPRAWILAHAEAELAESEARRFQDGLMRVKGGEALPYVLGWWAFFGRRFRVTPEVMIPRPETELLVGHALRRLADSEGARSVLDLGTGCGCIGVTLAAERPGIRLIAADISRRALEVARSNAQYYGVEKQVHCVQADLLSALAGPFDLVCANLPYIPSHSLANLEVGRREPKLALDGGEDGLALIGRSLAALPGVLRDGGAAFFEIEADQGVVAMRLAEQAIPESRVEVYQDLAGHDRLLSVQLGD